VLAAVLHRPRELRIEEVEKPKVTPGKVLVEVKACGVCMTDLHMYMWEFPVKTPVILGHEFSGVIAELGDNAVEFEVGDRVAVDPALSCGVCEACVSGRNNLCERLTAIGGAGDVIVNGAFAEYTMVPKEAIGKIPAEISFDEGAFVEPLGCCIHGVDVSSAGIGDVVALIGAGPIGLLLLQLIKLVGASQILVVDMKDERLQLAATLGADVVVNPSKEDPVGRLKELTHGKGADVVIEAVGSPVTVKQAVQMVRKGGRVVIFGVAPVESRVDISPFDTYFREIEIVGSYAITREAFWRSISMLRSGRIKIEPLITERFKLSELAKAFDLMEKKEGLKKLIYP